MTAFYLSIFVAKPNISRTYRVPVAQNEISWYRQRESNFFSDFSRVFLIYLQPGVEIRQSGSQEQHVLVRLAGIEPATHCLEGSCSIH